MSKYKISDAMDGDWMPIEIDIATATHPGLVGRGPIAHAIYMRLLGLVWEIRRDELPESYRIVKNLQQRCWIADRATFLTGLEALRHGNLILTSDPVGIPLGFRFFHVLGLKVKWAHRLKTSVNRIELEQNRTEEEGATPKTASCPTAFPEVFEVLNSIDAKHYRTCQTSTGFERDLTAQSSRLGKERISAEVESLRTWIEGQFAIGKIKREANHNPQARLIRWLKGCHPGDDQHANGKSKARVSIAYRMAQEAGVR